MVAREEGSALLEEISLAATGLQRDLLPLVHRVTRERTRRPDETVELDEISFWFKCLIHEALAFVDGLCHTMRVTLARFATELDSELTPKQRVVIRDPSLRLPIGRNIALTFRILSKFFGATTFVLDTGGTDYRAFSAMVDARERFTHPKAPKDVHPFAALATMKPAINWVLFSWRELLEACISDDRELSEGHLPPAPDRGPQFDEQRLAAFDQAEREFLAGHEDDDLVDSLRATIFALMDDTAKAFELVNGRDRAEADVSAGFALRNLARFLYTEVEGTIFIAAFSLRKYGFADGEPTKALLMGEHETVRERVADTLDAFSRHFGNERRVRRDGDGWESFCDFRGLRDRLVHPKEPSDLLVRPGEVDLILRAFRWWIGDPHSCLNLDGDKLVRLVER